MNIERMKRQLPVLRRLAEDEAAAPGERASARARISEYEAAIKDAGPEVMFADYQFDVDTGGFGRRPIDPFAGVARAMDHFARASRSFDSVLREFLDETLEQASVFAMNRCKPGDPERMAPPWWPFRPWPQRFGPPQTVGVRAAKVGTDFVAAWACPACGELTFAWAYPEMRPLFLNVGPLLGLAVDRIATGADCSLCPDCWVGMEGVSTEAIPWFEFERRLSERESAVPSAFVNAVRVREAGKGWCAPRMLERVQAVCNGYGPDDTGVLAGMVRTDVNMLLLTWESQGHLLRVPEYEVVQDEGEFGGWRVRWLGPMVKDDQRDVFA